MTQRLVLLDFDGTLTKKDTLFEFIRFHHGTLKFIIGFILLSPIMFFFKTGLLSNNKTKETVLRFFFRNMPASEFNKSCLIFATTVIPTLIRHSALQLLEEEKRKKSAIVVVSASPENWVKPWCDIQHIHCLATHLQIAGDTITGNLDGANCYGIEKVNRIKQAFSLNEYSVIAAYGDSSGDKEMLALAQEPHYRAL